MKERILTWLWQQLQPLIEAAIRAEAERLIAELRSELERQAAEQQAARPPAEPGRAQRRYIGQ